MPATDLLPRDPNNVYLIIFLAAFLAERAFSMAVKGAQVLRGRNGNGRGKGKTDKPLSLEGLMCTPLWDGHKDDTRICKETSSRNERSLSTLKRESLITTREAKAQTVELKAINKTLIKIAKNGDSKES